MTLFPILLEIEEPALGKVLKTLRDMPGVAKLHLDLDGAGKKKGASKPRVVNPKEAREPKAERGPRGKDILLTELMSGPKTGDQLRAALERHQFKASSAHPLLGDLRAKQIIESPSSGVYQLTPAALAQLRTPAPSQLPPPARNGTDVKRRTMGAGQILLIKAMRDPTKTKDGVITRAQLVEMGVAAGMTERAVDGTITRMKQSKLLSVPEPAHYKLTAKAAKKFPFEESPQANQEG